jgi:hypothetical protein
MYWVMMYMMYWVTSLQAWGSRGWGADDGGTCNHQDVASETEHLIPGGWCVSAQGSTEATSHTPVLEIAADVLSSLSRLAVTQPTMCSGSPMSDCVMFSRENVASISSCMVARVTCVGSACVGGTFITHCRSQCDQLLPRKSVIPIVHTATCDNAVIVLV